MLLGSNAGDIIAALCPGDDIAVCCQQEEDRHFRWWYGSASAPGRICGGRAFCFREGDGLPGSASGNSGKPPDKGVLFCVLQIYLT